MHHRVNLVLRENTFEFLTVSQIRFAERGSWRHGS
jgi:hypothetical protein